jgi:peptide/nickel transport system substrate-binding protein
VDDLLLDPLGAERDRPAKDLSLRKLLALSLAVVALIAGCGDDDGDTETGSALPSAGGGGTLAYAVPGLPATLDPLAAQDHTALTIARQVHEPLVARLRGPYGAAEVLPGLAVSAKPSENRTVWTITLRSGVRFQDGTPFNAAAVLVNTRRWSTSAAGRALLPNLFAVDAPRPDQVRFLFDRPTPDVPLRLRSPRLGIVSPQALDPQSGAGSRFRAGAAQTGTGTFELSDTSPGPLQLSRHAAWWGTAVGLGPALDGVVFTAAAASAQRLSLLRAGSVQVADPLGPPELAAIASDPLLVPVAGPRGGIGLDGSVRGIDSARRVPLLSRVWLTNLAP